MKRTIDRPLLIATLTLLIVGFFIFTSAAMGLLAREAGASFEKVLFKQLAVALVGIGVLYLTSQIPYRSYRKYAFYIFLASILFTLLVFVPHVGFSHGGATRWISLGGFTFQPSEALKLGFIIYLAAWISGMREKIKTMKFGLLPFMVLVGIVSVILIKQPDTDAFLITFAAGFAMYAVGGGPWRHAALLIGIGLVGFVALSFWHPYIQERLITFVNPSHDPLGASYQVQQSLIAIGSGGFFGRGFGQSVQKFSFLPEPIGDSIFAVFAEEWGFVGAIALILLFLFFALRVLKIAAGAPDLFGGLLSVGIAILILTQSFINIASMLGIFPLSGTPLLFVSQGGSALLFALAEVGILLNISKSARRAE